MSTDLTELRRTLAVHADRAGTDVLPPSDRLAAVRGRVRDVRRRRQAVAALVAVVALGVGVAVALPGTFSAQPAARPHVGGREAPATMTSLGYGYTFASATSGDQRADIHLKAADQPRLVSWAGSGDVVRVSSDGDLLGTQSHALTFTGDAFSDFALVPAGQAQQLTVRGSGRVALAVYDLSTRAHGVTQHGLTWRYDVAGGALVSAATGAVGETSVSGVLTLPAGSLTFRAVCSGAPKDAQVEIAVAGQGQLWGGCGDGALSWDGAGSSATSFDSPQGSFGRPGRTVAYTVSLVRRVGGGWQPVQAAAGVQVAVGVYRTAPAGGRVGTSAVAAEIEQSGHLWRLQHLTTSPPGQRVLRTELDAGAVPVVVWTVTDQTLRGTTTTLIGGREAGSSGDGRDGGGSQMGVGTLVDQSVSAEVRVTRAGPHTVLGLATYVEAD